MRQCRQSLSLRRGVLVQVLSIAEACRVRVTALQIAYISGGPFGFALLQERQDLWPQISITSTFAIWGGGIFSHNRRVLLGEGLWELMHCKYDVNLYLSGSGTTLQLLLSC